MKVLITGHQGYIGPIMTKLCKEAGHYVVGMDIGYFADQDDTAASMPAPDEEIRCDIRDVEHRMIEGVDAIVHLASLSNDPMGALNESVTYDINLAAGIRLAELAKECGVGRFVFASSCSIYGAAGEAGEPLDEAAPFSPQTAYAVSKVELEAALRGLAADGFSPVYLRNATAYGVSPRIRFDLVLNNLVGWAKITGAIKVLSDGTPWRPLVHIEDISRAAVSALAAPVEAIHDRAFNIGRSDANYRVSEIAQSVARAVAGSRVEITGETAGDTRSYRVNFDRAHAELPGFRPKWTLEEGIRELCEWFDRVAPTVEAFESHRYVRLKKLEELIATGVIDQDLRRQEAKR